MDIVCSAVSCLFQTMIASMEALTEDKIEYTISPGCSGVRFGSLSDISRILVDSFFIGICGVAGAYPENVTIVEAAGPEPKSRDGQTKLGSASEGAERRTT